MYLEEEAPNTLQSKQFVLGPKFKQFPETVYKTCSSALHTATSVESHCYCRNIVMGKRGSYKETVYDEISTNKLQSKQFVFSPKFKLPETTVYKYLAHSYFSGISLLLQEHCDGEERESQRDSL